MSIIKDLEQYNENNIFFCEPIKNNIMNDGTFIRIMYCSECFTMNGIALLITLNDSMVEQYYNKYKCSFNPLYHKDIIDKVKNIEESLLNQVNITNKIPQFKIYEQLKNGNIKLFFENNGKTKLYMLKISGIWETDKNYGATYKFAKITHL